jgi:hypothetical protein
MTKRVCKHCKREIYDVGGLSGALGWLHRHSGAAYCDVPITPRAEPDLHSGENPSDLLEGIVEAVDTVRDLIEEQRRENEQSRKADVVPFPR